MLYHMVPADELCLFACGLYLNIHITVDYHQGHWSTLNLGETSHDLISALSDVHLVYRGFCKYNYLCRKLELKTKGCKILNHKYKNSGKIVLKKLTVCLTRVEEYNKMAKKLLTTVSKPLPNVTPASAKNKALKDLRIILQKVDEQTDLVKYSRSKDSTITYNVTTESAKSTNNKEKKAKDPCTIVKQRDLAKNSQDKDLNTTYNVTTKSAKLGNSNEKISKILCTTEEQNHGYTSDTDSTISYEITENVIGTIYFLTHVFTQNQKDKQLKS